MLSLIIAIMGTNSHVVQDIALACEDSRQYVGQVVDMAENMTQIFENVDEVSRHLQEIVEQ